MSDDPSLFSADQIPQVVTTDEILSELQRELSMRRMLYPQWIQSGRLGAATANLQIVRLEAAISIIKASNHPTVVIT